MCIVGGKVERATTDLTVWKVVRKHKKVLYGIFKNCKGMSIGFGNNHASKRLTAILSEQETCFDWGFGITCFETQRRARYYAQKLRDRFVRGYGDQICVLRMTIPEGVRYCIGAIGPMMHGSGLPAIRCERLEFPKGVRKNGTS